MAVNWSDPCARAGALWDAYCRLISGQQESSVSYAGNGVTRTVNYSSASLDRLLNEIRAAQNECAAARGLAPPRRRFAIIAGSRRISQ